MKISIINAAYHRNGIAGAPFEVTLFEDRSPESSRKLAILFEQPHHCAVLDVDKLAHGDIAFGSNSWRGDQYEPSLRAALAGGTPQRVHEAADSTGQAVGDPSGEDAIDIDQLLERRREVAVIWSIEDAQSVRPDLTDDQAWQVLQQCRNVHDCNYGFTWDLIESIAGDLFPAPDEGDSQ